jgi:hypothetical protein
VGVREEAARTSAGHDSRALNGFAPEQEDLHWQAFAFAATVPRRRFQRGDEN